MKRLEEQMKRISEQLRTGKIEADPIKMTEKASDGVGAKGRSFNADEKENAMKQIPNQETQPKIENPVRTPEQGTAQPVKGRSREALTNGQDAGDGRVRTQPEQDTKDAAKKMGEMKPLPEYRNAVDEYYKTILK
jgi:hypothetical protein